MPMKMDPIWRMRLLITEGSYGHPANRRPGAMTVAAAHGADSQVIARRLAVDSYLAEQMLSSPATAAAPIHFAGRPAGLLSV